MLVDSPDAGVALAAGQIDGEHTGETFRPGKLRRRLRGGNEEGVAIVVVELDELAAEDAALNAGIGLPRA